MSQLIIQLIMQLLFCGICNVFTITLFDIQCTINWHCICSLYHLYSPMIRNMNSFKKLKNTECIICFYTFYWLLVIEFLKWLDDKHFMSVFFHHYCIHCLHVSHFTWGSPDFSISPVINWSHKKWDFLFSESYSGVIYVPVLACSDIQLFTAFSSLMAKELGSVFLLIALLNSR